MQLYNECLVCLFKQVLEAGKYATEDEAKIRSILLNLADKISHLDFKRTAPSIVEEIHKDIKNELGIDDPYLNFKEKHMEVAHKIYPYAKDVVENNDNKIETALLLAATGNSIDAGISNNIDIEKILKDDINNGFTINNIEQFKKELADSKNLLIIADNSGEGYFDKILIEELRQIYSLNIFYAVRSEPILNDITLKEAQKIGINQVAQLIDSGSKAPGLLLDETTEEFKNIFNNADIIISKGQGNYEALSEKNISIYYLLKAKCKVIAREFGIKKNGLIFKKLLKEIN